MIIDYEFFRKKATCTACQKETAVYTYPGYGEDNSFLMLCEKCTAALAKEMADDKCKLLCGNLDEYFGKTGEKRFIKAGIRFERETQND